MFVVVRNRYPEPNSGTFANLAVRFGANSTLVPDLTIIIPVKLQPRAIRQRCAVRGAADCILQAFGVNGASLQLA